MLEELWVPVEGFPNYEVSNYGRVVNVNSGRELKAVPHHSGFLKINLFRDNVRHYFYLHRLVARAFFVDYSEEYTVELINKIRNDCTVANITITRNRRKSGNTDR